MAQFVIPIRDEDLKDEIEAAFSSKFANPDELSGENLVIKHVANYIRGVLNDVRLEQARQAAEQGASVEDSLE